MHFYLREMRTLSERQTEECLILGRVPNLNIRSSAGIGEHLEKNQRRIFKNNFNDRNLDSVNILNVINFIQLQSSWRKF